MIDTYLKNVAAITKQGDAREESYYRSLADLLEEYSRIYLKKIIHVTTIPTKTEGGNPDFRVWDGSHSIVGYVEAKKPSVNLDDAEDTEQLQRYIETFPNLILTNFYEFWLYRDGKLRDKVLLARPFIAAKLKTVPPAEHQEDFLALLKMFFDYSRPKKYTTETLARELAVLTRFLRDEIIKSQLAEEQTKGEGALFGFYKAFRDTLIANLSTEEFADLYAQTLTYGLFAARTRSENSFNRKLAYTLIPKTIGILRDIFRFISVEEPPPQLEWIVDDIAEVLAIADVKSILSEYFKKGKGTDPIYHFYETFLAEYNPGERERRGVYYTPEPVVSYIVRSLNIILKETFGLEAGFGTPSVTVLDPAAGTLTFLAKASRLAVEEYVSKYGRGTKAKVIEDHILKHFYAFELMMAPYAAGHLKIGYLLDELGHKLTGDERFQFYLTNTLEMVELAETFAPGMSSLSQESRLAGKVKKETPILVVLGNPPYSGISANASEKVVEIKKGQKYIQRYRIVTRNENGRLIYYLEPQEKEWRGDKKHPDKLYKVKQKTWIGGLIETYKMVDGKPLGEKNPKWLQDDYVKFIRFAQWKIDQIGEGILGFITNHSYLDNPTFRGMRQSLMNSFDEVYVLDLHGNSLKKEKAPDGSKDENVFDIQQGVAIGLYVKKKHYNGQKKIYHGELWGLRDKKYGALDTLEVHSTKWRQLKPSPPFYLFVPRDEELLQQFQAYPSIPEIFPINSVGIVTARDHFVVDFDRNELERRIFQFRQSTLDDVLIAKTYNLKDTGAWKLHEARKSLAEDENWKEHFTKILYRPFDQRDLFYHDDLIERSRKEVMRHMLQENLSLITVRKVPPNSRCNYFFVSQHLVSNGAIRSDNQSIDTIFPLYIYDEHSSSGSGRSMGKVSYQAAFLFEPAAGYSHRKPNINPKLIESLEKNYKKNLTPEGIFYYIYAVLYSNAYRKRYAEFLKTDFPRVPFASSHKIFQSLARKGEELVALHLLKSKKLNNPIARCEGKGEFVVEKVTYIENEKRVYINPSKYFAGIRKNVWEYHIGGYQVAEKWLKDRKGRTLSAEDVVHYCRVVTALAETMKVQEMLDELFQGVEKSVLEIKMKG